MKRLVLVIAALALSAGVASAQAPAGAPMQYNNMQFFVNGCQSFTPPVPAPAAGYAVCSDTTTGATYMWNGSAFVLNGGEVWATNMNMPTITATATFYYPMDGVNVAPTASAGAQNELPLNFTSYIRNLKCQETTAPGASASDTFTVLTASALGSTPAASSVTCSITGASVTTCSDTTHLAGPFASGTVMLISDFQYNDFTARNAVCSYEVDNQ